MWNLWKGKSQKKQEGDLLKLDFDRVMYNWDCY